MRYQGKMVLSRANAPILNVQYERNACGPFRDWSWQEGMFDAPGTDVAPGIRMCTSRLVLSSITGQTSATSEAWLSGIGKKCARQRAERRLVSLYKRVEISRRRSDSAAIRLRGDGQWLRLQGYISSRLLAVRL